MIPPARSLPIRLAPVVGEALDSWLAALAHRSGIGLRDILIAAGPPVYRRGGPTPDYTTLLTDQEAERFAQATGVPAEHLHAMTLRRYDGHALLLRPGRRLTQRFTLWGRGLGSRYCPQCLAEQDGRWPLRWRLTWSMACVGHRVLLAYTCPACGTRPHSHGLLSRGVQPGSCRGRAPGEQPGPKNFCQADLTRSPVHALAPDSPVLAAQEWIDGLLGQIEDGVRDPALRNAFDDLTVLASRMLLRAEPGDFQALGQEIDRARTRFGNDWRYAPVDAAVLAGPLTRAADVIRDLSSDTALAAVRTLAYRDASTSKKPTIDRVRGRARTGSDGLEQLFWRAVDERLDTSARLRYRTCTPRPRIPVPGSATLPLRTRWIPQLLWLEWALMLVPPTPRTSGNHTDYRHHRAGLATVLLFPGWWQQRHGPLISMLHGHRRIPIARYLAKLAQSGTDVLAAICLLAEYLDEHAAPIDYQRRRTLTGAGLLPDDAWSDICRLTGTHPEGRRQLLAMRRVLFQRITGCDLHTIPGPLRIHSEPRDLLPILTAPLRTALDGHAADYLADHGIVEPVTWSPPMSLVEFLDLPGRSATSIDTTHAAWLIRNQRMAPAAVAHKLGTTVEHLKLAFDTAPAGAVTGSR